MYLNIGSVTAGVLKKLEAKRSFLTKSGVEAILVMVVPNDYTQSEKHHIVHVNFNVVKKIARIPMLWRLAGLLEHRIIYRALQEKSLFDKYDIILMRYPIADFFLWRWMARIGSKHKIVFEHNTMELRELSIRATNSFYYKYSRWSEMLFGASVRKMASGFVGVTDEITREQLQRAGILLPNKTVSNGIDVSALSIRNGEFFTGKELNLIVLAGSEAPWHGIDILLNSLEKYKGDCIVNVYLAGKVSESIQERVRHLSTVFCLPTLYGDELNQVINRCHIGIGTLGIDTSFMKEACTLKVREYWARGLPFVIGYTDTDLKNNDAMRSYYLQAQVNEQEGTISMQAIIDFANQVYALPDFAQQMRMFAMERIHYEVKAYELVTFLKSL